MPRAKPASRSSADQGGTAERPPASRVAGNAAGLGDAGAVHTSEMLMDLQGRVGNGALHRLLTGAGDAPAADDASVVPARSPVPAIQLGRRGGKVKARARARAEEREDVGAQRILDGLVGRSGRELLEIAAGAGGSMADLVALVGAAPGGTPVQAIADLLLAAGPNPPVAAVTRLVTAAGPGTAITDVTALVDALDGAWSPGDTATVLGAVRAHHGAIPLVGQVLPLLVALAGVGTAGDAATLLNTIAALATPAQISALATAAAGLDPAATLANVNALVVAAGANATIVQTTALITAVQARPPAGTVAQVAALVTAAGNLANVAVDLVALIGAVAANGTLVQTTGLVAAARQHQPAGTLPQLTAVVTAAGNVANVAADLTALLNAVGVAWSLPDTAGVLTAVGAHGTVPEVTALATAALAHPPVTAGQLTALVQAAPQVANLAADLTALINATPPNAVVNAMFRLVAACVAADGAVTVPQVTALIQAGPQPANLAHLKALVEKVGGSDTVAATTGLLTAVRTHRPDSPVAQVRDLVTAAGNPANVATDLAALVNALGGRGSLPQTGDLVAAVVANETLPAATVLVNAVRAHAGAATAQHILRLLQAFAPAPNLTVDVAALVGAVAANGNLAQTITLIGAARGHHPGTTAQQMAALVTAAGNVAGVCPGLVALLNAAGVQGTVPDTTALVTAVAGWANLADTAALVTAVAANGTVAQTTALVTAARGHDGTATIVNLTALVQAFAPAVNIATNLTALVNAVGANATIVQTTALVARVKVFNPATGVTRMTALVTAVGHVAGFSAALTVLMNAIGANGTVAEISALIAAARGHNPATTLADITALVQAFPRAAGLATGLTALVNAAAANGTVVQTTALVNAARGFKPATTIPQMTALVAAPGNVANVCTDLLTLVNTIAANGTIQQTTTLITTAVGHNPPTTVLEINALAAAFLAAPNLSLDLTALVNAVANQSTVPQTTALVNAARGFNAATTVQQMRALVAAAGAHVNVCPDLTALVNAVQGNGTVPQITTMVTQATTTLGAGHTNDLLVLINRNRAQNTPPRVQALLFALNPNTRARYLLVEPRIVLFLRDGAVPNHGQRHYNRFGRHFNCNRWDYFYQRHTEQYFVFGMAAGLNSMWGPGTNTEGQLNGTMGALGNAQAANLAGPGDVLEQAGGNEVGVSDTGWITHLMPTGNAVITYYLAEINAINNLR